MSQTRCALGDGEMCRFLLVCTIAFLTLGTSLRAADPGVLDLRRGVPTQSYLVVYSTHNSERDYQRAHLQQVYAKVTERQLVPQIMNALTSRISANDLEKAKAVYEELKTAVAPIDVSKLLACEESVYAQTMNGLASQHLLLLRLPPESAAAYQKGIVNLFRMAAKHSKGEIRIEVDADSPAHVTSMRLPDKVPFRPAVAHHDNIFVLSSSVDYLRQSLDGLLNKGVDSKFDDPRLDEALTQLPDAEDAVVFYDGRQQFLQLRTMLEVLAQKAGDTAEAKHWLGIAKKIVDELSVMDYEVTVNFTEDNLNRASTIGKLIPGTEDRLLAKCFGRGEGFDQWQRWIPADASSYAITTGTNLLPIYEHGMNFVRENFPDAQPALTRFEQWQEANDLHLARDLLEAFSGECVRISMPSDVPTPFDSAGGTHHVLALRCHKPERIRDLLHRLVGHLNQFPMVKLQRLRITEVDNFDDFEEISAGLFALVGVRPVIGYRDGWMMLGSNEQAVRKLLDTRVGVGPSIVDSDEFKKFHLSVDGPVRAVSYTDLARQTRELAKTLKQAGAILPIVIGIAGLEADAEDLTTWQEIVGLLPSLGAIIEEFDFFEARLSVTQEGTQQGTYIRHIATYVRPAEHATIAVESSSE